MNSAALRSPPFPVMHEPEAACASRPPHGSSSPLGTDLDSREGAASLLSNLSQGKQAILCLAHKKQNTWAPFLLLLLFL